ncbi:MAG: hypothetical protein ACI9OU_001798 [Candidatus Promineifilaceae bacterium]|jgi:hypothetical protein
MTSKTAETKSDKRVGQKMATAKKASPKKAKAKAKSTKPKPLSPEARYRVVEFEAYLLAEAGGFQGDPGSYWLQAEDMVAGSGR